jgi:hypothetical protein
MLIDSCSACRRVSRTHRGGAANPYQPKNAAAWSAIVQT